MNPIKLTISGDKQKGSDYMYFWLKYVNGFDNTQHCARCLTGSYSKKLSKKVFGDPEPSIILLDESVDWTYIYLCGVSKQGYKHNLHIPVQYKDGATYSIVDLYGVQHTFENAEKLSIPALPDKFMGLTKAFTSCRNFQFGYHYFSEKTLDTEIVLA